MQTTAVRCLIILIFKFHIGTLPTINMIFLTSVIMVGTIERHLGDLAAVKCHRRLAWKKEYKTCSFFFRQILFYSLIERKTGKVVMKYLKNKRSVAIDIPMPCFKRRGHDRERLITTLWRRKMKTKILHYVAYFSW